MSFKNLTTILFGFHFSRWYKNSPFMMKESYLLHFEATNWTMNFSRNKWTYHTFMIVHDILWWHGVCVWHQVWESGQAQVQPMTDHDIEEKNWELVLAAAGNWQKLNITVSQDQQQCSGSKTFISQPCKYNILCSATNYFDGQHQLFKRHQKLFTTLTFKSTEFKLWFKNKSMDF